MSAANGYVLYEDAARVIIATGFTRPSANVKTGPMVQVWILHRTIEPHAAVATGADSVVCGDCPLRGNGGGGERACYVDVGKAPLSIFRAYHRGAYPLAPVDPADLFRGRAVRFGAYGDPAYIPAGMLAGIAQAARSHTGYTHQWRKLGAPYRHYLMASVDTPSDVREAESLGWRWFGLVSDARRAPELDAVLCPADPARGVTCSTCTLCGGSLTRARSVAILPHGPGARFASTCDIEPLDWAEEMADRMEARAVSRAVEARRSREARRRRLQVAAVGRWNTERVR